MYEAGRCKGWATIARSTVVAQVRITKADAVWRLVEVGCGDDEKSAATGNPDAEPAAGVYVSSRTARTAASTSAGVLSTLPARRA